MRKRRSILSNKTLTQIIDRRLARIYGKDAEIIVIYPLRPKRSDSKLDDPAFNKKDKEDD